MGENRSGDGSTPVTIYGRTYHLRGDGDGEHLQRLASIVDRKMQEVARSTGTADTVKLAILAALNIANDSIEDHGSAGRLALDVEDRLAGLVGVLEQAIAAAGSDSAPGSNPGLT